MKKEDRERDKNERNREGNFSGSEEEIGEYGFEYDFFISEKNTVIGKRETTSQTQNLIKGEDSTDQSKTFFLPDFFSHED
jgi:hypothetical protein